MNHTAPQPTIVTIETMRLQALRRCDRYPPVGPDATLLMLMARAQAAA
jgi:hypothetical protein